MVSLWQLKVDSRSMTRQRMAKIEAILEYAGRLMSGSNMVQGLTISPR